MALDSETFSVGNGDPPAVTQPTLPPPAVVASADLQGPAAPTPETLLSRIRRSPKLALVGAVGAIGLAVGYAAVSASHNTVSAATVTAAMLPMHAADLTAHIQRSFNEPAAPAADRPCSTLSGAVPVVLFTAEGNDGSATTNIVRSAIPMAKLDQKLEHSRRIALLKTTSLVEPVASVGVPAPGRYEGELVIVDTSSGASLCRTKVVAWSSSIADEMGISERTLRDDFTDRVQNALAEGGSRLHIELEL